VVAQAFTRRAIARARYLNERIAALSLSCWFRCCKAQALRLTLLIDRASCIIQSRYVRHGATLRIECQVKILRFCDFGVVGSPLVRWRSYQVRKLFCRCKFSIVVIQRISRGALQRPVYIEMKSEAEQEAKLDSKVKILQRRLAEAEMRWIQSEKLKSEANNHLIYC
ncbi:MAG: hypothetical protein ACREBR_03100, partial [bacterium]